ncbi:MAG TPA: hypothetical protein VM053_11235 [Gemmatimonadaceae bacterium]|nr:hypothetical protein [Gemmatimonadaceae bacterium]
MKRTIAAFALSILAIGCGPEPSEPADTNLAGTWKANAHLFTMSNIRLEMIQEPQGIVSGRWYADGDGGLGGCFPAIPCKASGQLIGRNTVSQIDLQLLGIGTFEGVLKTGGTMRGAFAVENSYDTITFNRTSTAISTNHVSGN